MPRPPALDSGLDRCLPSPGPHGAPWRGPNRSHKPDSHASQTVLWLDVAMDDILRVNKLETMEKLVGKHQHCCEREVATLPGERRNIGVARVSDGCFAVVLFADDPPIWVLGKGMAGEVGRSRYLIGGSGTTRASKLIQRKSLRRLAEDGALAKDELPMRCITGSGKDYYRLWHSRV